MTSAWPATPHWVNPECYEETCIYCKQPIRVGGEGTTHYYEHVNGNIKCDQQKETDNGR